MIVKKIIVVPTNSIVGAVSFMLSENGAVFKDVLCIEMLGGSVLRNKK